MFQPYLKHHIKHMKEIYEELNKLLGFSPVIELKETEKAKDLKANLFVKFGDRSPGSESTGSNSIGSESTGPEITGSESTGPENTVHEDADDYEDNSHADLSGHNDNCRSDLSGHEIITDRRIKVFVADIDSFGKVEKAVRLIRTHIPDLKIFAAGADMTNIPDICTGFLQTNRENAIFTAKFMSEHEGINISQKAAATLGAAIELAKNSNYDNNNILVIL